jgi:transposase
MANDRVVKKLYEWKPISTRLAARPKIIWENVIKRDLRILKINNWTICIQDRVE